MLGLELFVGREHDRLVAPEAGEGARLTRLAEQERSGAFRVAAREQRRLAGEAELVHDGHDVIGELRPPIAVG